MPQDEREITHRPSVRLLLWCVVLTAGLPIGFVYGLISAPMMFSDYDAGNPSVGLHDVVCAGGIGMLGFAVAAFAAWRLRPSRFTA